MQPAYHSRTLMCANDIDLTFILHTAVQLGLSEETDTLLKDGCLKFVHIKKFELLFLNFQSYVEKDIYELNQLHGFYEEQNFLFTPISFCENSKFDYVGKFPSLQDFQYKQMSEKEKKRIAKFYANCSYRDFDFRNNIMAASKQYTNILLKSSLKYLDDCFQIQVSRIFYYVYPRKTTNIISGKPALPWLHAKFRK